MRKMIFLLPHVKHVFPYAGQSPPWGILQLPHSFIVDFRGGSLGFLSFSACSLKPDFCRAWTNESCVSPAVVSASKT